MGNIGRIRLASAAALMGGVFGAGVMVAGPASAAPGQTGHGITFPLDFIGNFLTNPNSLNPLGPPLTIPPGCPFDYNAVFNITGNGVIHQTGNNNGFWTGGTIEGSTTLNEMNAEGVQGPNLYTGRATAWGGFGTNNNGTTDVTAQAEEGEQFHFQGVSTDGNNTPLRVDIAYHATMNNNGTFTNFSESVVCS